MTDFLNEAYALFDFSQSIRRDLHRHPELGFQEVRTAGLIIKELNNLGLELTSGVAETGVVAMIEGGRPGPTLLLRFDMDALPIQEDTGAEYASEHPGLMHACGHDGHVAIGLTVARLLYAHREELAGSVKLVFQPAEEGLGGAERMVHEGVLESPKPKAALALHIWNERPLGWLGISPGPVMAASEIFHVKISGKGGHGAIPHQAVDPIAAAAQIVTGLQTIVSRNVSPLQSAVVSVTTVRGGDAFNVIPSSAVLEGTIRSFEPDVRAMVLERFERIVTSMAEAMGCQADIDIKPITPAVINHPDLTAQVQATAAALLPEDKIMTSYATMGSEDMAFFLQRIPGCFFFVGSANPKKNLSAAHHHPCFDFDEQVLPRAAALMSAAAYQILR